MSRERKPLTARSVLASTLLGADPPDLPVRRLVETAALFGVSDNSARTTLSRMVSAGEVVSSSGHYRLTGRLLERHRRQEEGRRPVLRPWTGRWKLAIVVQNRRSAGDRAELRASLSRLRMAEWREGVWVRPDNLEVTPGGLTRSHCAWAVADLEDDDLPLWDLEGWAKGARRLLGELLEPPSIGSLAPGFLLSAAVLRHLAADPLLPEGLLPERWPAAELRSVYDEWDRMYRELLAAWQQSREDNNESDSDGSAPIRLLPRAEPG